jgi:hypothetical protein
MLDPTLRCGSWWGQVRRAKKVGLSWLATEYFRSV